MQVSIVDAYCPHLGANLGVGGRVHGNCIECPFHGWQFDGESGQCVKIPYADKVCGLGKRRRKPGWYVYRDKWGILIDSLNWACCGYE